MWRNHEVRPIDVFAELETEYHARSQDDPEQLRENTDRHVKEVWFPGTHSDM